MANTMERSIGARWQGSDADYRYTSTVAICSHRTGYGPLSNSVQFNLVQNVKVASDVATLVPTNVNKRGIYDLQRRTPTAHTPLVPFANLHRKSNRPTKFEPVCSIVNVSILLRWDGLSASRARAERARPEQGHNRLWPQSRGAKHFCTLSSRTTAISPR